MDLGLVSLQTSVLMIRRLKSGTGQLQTSFY